MRVTLQEQAEAARLMLLRRQARRSQAAWAELNGFQPALHHRLIIDELNRVAKRQTRRLMIMVPPGSAKSTYASVLFPPWCLAQQGAIFLACSYAATLSKHFGKRCRNLIDAYGPVLGYKLCQDSQAADDWETTNGGRYFCAGVGAGIAGHRADFGLIDDYLGSQEDADSELVRESQWQWYWNDFWPRLKPTACQVIIANRRHEEDLIGRLLAKEANKWRVIRLPMLAEADDPLGRPPGARLWPEWFTQEQVDTAQSLSRTWACLYQQRPVPEEGEYFKAQWLLGYEPQDLPKELRVYAAADFAVTEELHGNKTCCVFGGLDEQGVLWILPSIYWRRDPPNVVVDSIIDLSIDQKPIWLWAERGHISKSLKPYMRARMHERGEYVNIEEVTPSKAKDVRARSIQARMAQGMVRFPKFAKWWPDAEHELLMAFNGRDDDFVDALAHLGRGIDKMARPVIAEPLVEQDVNEQIGMVVTMRQIRDDVDRQEREHARLIADM